MKRKLLCLLFAAVMVLSLAACGGNNKDEASDFEAFAEVQKNMQNVKDMEFKMDMKASVSGEEAFDMSMSGTGKEVIASKDDIQMEMRYKMNIPGLDSSAAGTSMEGTMYMKDQAIYMDVMGQKLKMDASNEMAAMMNVDTDQMLDITEDMVSDLKVSKDGSDTVYTFHLDAAKAMDYFEKNVDSSQLTSTEGVTFDKMDVTVTAGEDNMAKKVDMDCGLTTTVEDESTKMDYQVTMEYVSINTDLKIDFPDFSQYQELSV